MVGTMRPKTVPNTNHILKDDDQASRALLYRWGKVRGSTGRAPFVAGVGVISMIQLSSLPIVYRGEPDWQ
jgi:hypothetical protein